MELRQLEGFVAVAEEGNFTRAAQRVFVGQSALSVSVRTLERDLGVRLFERSTHHVELTDAGRALLPEARRTLAAAAGARAAVTDAAEGLRGTLRLGLMQALVLVDVAGMLARFHRERPRVEIRPRPAPGGSVALVDEVRRGGLDATFAAVERAPWPALEVTVLASEPLVVVCPVDHPLAGRSLVSPAEVAGEAWVDFTPGWGLRAAGDEAFAAAGVSRGARLEVPDVSTLAELVRAGLGIGILTDSVLRSLGARARLASVELDSASRFDVGFVVPADRPLSPVTRAFAALVRETAGAASGAS